MDLQQAAQQQTDGSVCDGDDDIAAGVPGSLIAKSGGMLNPFRKESAVWNSDMGKRNSRSANAFPITQRQCLDNFCIHVRLKPLVGPDVSISFVGP